MGESTSKDFKMKVALSICKRMPTCPLHFGPACSTLSCSGSAWLLWNLGDPRALVPLCKSVCAEVPQEENHRKEKVYYLSNLSSLWLFVSMCKISFGSLVPSGCWYLMKIHGGGYCVPSGWDQIHLALNKNKHEEPKYAATFSFLPYGSMSKPLSLYVWVFFFSAATF